MYVHFIFILLYTNTFFFKKKQKKIVSDTYCGCTIAKGFILVICKGNLYFLYVIVYIIN